MKRIVSVLLLISLLIASAFTLAGCGYINKSEVSILWSGEDMATVPGSLIDCIERAMYTEKINYKHYGAGGSLSKQLEQVNSALNGSAQVLIVELVSENGLDFVDSQSVARQIVDAAKAKDVPVVFFNCSVDKDIAESYDKCVVIASNTSTIADVQGELIADYVKANFKAVDKNEDNKIQVFVSDTDTLDAKSVEKANSILATDDYKVSRHPLGFIGVGKDINLALEISANSESANLTDYELIITSDDVSACTILRELQALDYNTDKLKTQFVPIITVGESVDYKSLVLADRPEIPADLVIKADDSDKVIEQKNKDIKKLENLMKYYEENKHLVDLTVVDESDLNEMIYTTINVIDSGRIAGTAIEDKDAIASAVATVVKNFIKGNDVFANVASKVKEGEEPSVIVDGKFVQVRHAAYGV